MNEGASFTGFTVIVNEAGVDVSCPPLAVPPSSLSTTSMVAVPDASAAGVYVRVPVLLIAGAAENRVGFVFPVTRNVSVWPDSPGGPALMFVAQFVTD